MKISYILNLEQLSSGATTTVPKNTKRFDAIDIKLSQKLVIRNSTACCYHYHVIITEIISTKFSITIISKILHNNYLQNDP